MYVFIYALKAFDFNYFLHILKLVRSEYNMSDICGIPNLNQVAGLVCLINIWYYFR